MLRLALLGPPVVERDGEPATFDTRKSVALLALLAGSAEPRTRDGLAASLWPDSDDARARASLRRTLSVTAAAVGPSLEISRTTIGLDRSHVWCDLWEFDRLAESEDRPSLAQAASLYRADFLAGFQARAGAEFDLWHERTAEEHRQRLSEVLSRLVAALVTEGTLGGALRHARRWLALDDLHEPAHRALMRVLAWADQRAAALAQYRSCVRVLAEELGVEPLAETTALYEAIRLNGLGPPPSAGDAPAPGQGVPVSPSASPAARLARPLPFVGQERIVDALVAELGRRQDAGRAAVVVGPAGSGKTRIVEALRAAAGPLRPWVSARCQPGEQWLELGCVAELLRSAFAWRADLVELLDPHDLAEVGRVVPEADRAREVEAGPLETPGAQVRFFRAVTTALRTALSVASHARAPGVLVVEDAQHLDESSSRLLAYALRRLDELPALVVLTWQPEAGGPAGLAPVLDELAAEGRCSSYEPEPLGLGDVARVLEAARLPVDAAGQVLERTGGLPLLVAAYAEALSASRTGGGGAWATETGSLPSTVPVSVRPLLVQRLSTVSQATAQILSAAAVLGGGFDADLLRATSGRSPMEVADAVDEAVARRLLVERSPAPPGSPAERGSPTYEFPYDALRVVAYEGCGRARRRLLHNRAADMLARRVGEAGGSARCAAVSAHLELAGRPQEAAAWSWRAAQRSVSLYARQEALDHLRRALDLGHPATEVHLAVADVLITLGRYREAVMELERAAADGSSNGAAPASVEHRLAAVQERLGNTALAAAHLDAALDAASDPVLRARILADRAFVAYRSRDSDAGTWAARALEAAQATGDPAALAQAHNVAGVLESLAGDPEAAESSLRASLAAASSLGDGGLAVASLNNLARLLADVGRSDEALAAAEDALARGAEHGDVHRLAALHSNLADLLHAAGRGEESITHLKESASAFAGVDTGGDAVPGVWTLTEW